ncbi:MAG: MarR family winged helix-turn-helix transcriptional regulator [Maritimibacter sp.]
MTDFHNMPGHLIRRLNQIATGLFRDTIQTAGFDLTPVQFAALSALAKTPGIDQASLAAHIAYDKVTLGGVVDRLAAKGLLSRAPSATDRRAKALTLTPKGEAALAAATPAVRALQDDILDGLDPKERQTLIELLKKLTTAHESKVD